MSFEGCRQHLKASLVKFSSEAFERSFAKRSLLGAMVFKMTLGSEKVLLAAAHADSNLIPVNAKGLVRFLSVLSLRTAGGVGT